MQTDEFYEELTKMSNVVKVLAKELDILKKELDDLKKDNEALALEIDRLYRIRYEEVY